MNDDNTSLNSSFRVKSVDDMHAIEKHSSEASRIKYSYISDNEVFRKSSESLDMYSEHSVMRASEVESTLNGYALP